MVDSARVVEDGKSILYISAQEIFARRIRFLTTIPDVIDDYDSGVIVCPKCNFICNDTLAKALFEPISGIVLGYMLYCKNCHTRSFINMLGKPPLLDLSGRYALLLGKEG